MSMKTVAVANAKGGSTKTTTTSILAVRASQDSPSVAMFDLNEDQGNLTQWWLLRGEINMSPRLVTDLSNIPADAKRIEAEGTDWLFIDTPPLEMDLIEQAIVIADFVLIPVRTSFFDVSSVEPVTAMCRKHRKPFAFVLAAVDNHFKVLIHQTLATLRPEGPILEQQISHRLPYIQAITQGRTGAELSRNLISETDALWLEVKKRTEAAKVKGAAHA